MRLSTRDIRAKGGDAGAPQRSLVVNAQAEHTRPLPNPSLDGSLGQSHHPQGKGFTEQGVVETVTTFCPELQETVLCWPAEGRVRGVEEGEGFHTREERPGTFQEAQKGSKRKS